MRKLASCIVQRYQGNMLRKLADWEDEDITDRQTQFSQLQQKVREQEAQREAEARAEKERNERHAKWQETSQVWDKKTIEMARRAGYTGTDEEISKQLSVERGDIRQKRRETMRQKQQEEEERKTREENNKRQQQQQAAEAAARRQKMLGYGLWGGTGAVLGGALGGAIGSNYKKTLLGTLLGGGLGAGAGLGGKYLYDKWKTTPGGHSVLSRIGLA